MFFFLVVVVETQERKKLGGWEEVERNQSDSSRVEENIAITI